jgi:hypothetical protein
MSGAPARPYGRGVNDEGTKGRQAEMLTTDKDLLAIRLNELRIEADAERLARQAEKARSHRVSLWSARQPVHTKKVLTAG